jgi:serine/threonine protein kinase
LARTSLRDGDPAQIGQYRLTARLGSGGMGVVYLGVAPDGGLVAVKVLRPELADDPEFRRRFGREVTVLMRVRGVCTVRVIEADTDSRLPFMVTEYADGPSLAEYIDTYGPLSAEMLYGLATGLAEALTVIHGAGIVHRDLKPSNVILTASGPKVIDFGIAQTLDATSVTKTGMMVGSAGFMAPEQVTGRPGPAADIFVWGVTIGYAAAGQSPFGTGDTNAVLYRVLYADPDITAVPDALKPLVQAALAKEPQSRPAAHELLDKLTSISMRSAPVPDLLSDTPTMTVLAQTWQTRPQVGQQPESGRSVREPLSLASRPPATGSLLLDPLPPGARPPRTRKLPVSRRTATIGVSALALAAVAVLVVTLVTGSSPKVGPLAANQGGQNGSAATLPTYSGQQQRGVFQTIDRIVASGKTMVTTGSQASDGIVRQQFFASSDGGANWRLAPVQLPGGGQPPLGDVATRIAGGQDGWMAEGPQAIWTSQNGLSWTLAATHGITPQQPGDSVDVLTNTASGFVAAGSGNGSSGGSQAVIWVSHDGVTWQRLTAAQLGLTTATGPPHIISFATSRGNDTLISDGGSVWLSTDGGSGWTPVTVPVDHGAQDSIQGVSFDGSGLIAVRPGVTAGNAPDGVAYFSANGQTWQYAGTIDPGGGWSPGVVKGGSDGFVVTGTVKSQDIYVAYTSTGTGTTWRPTGSLGDTSSGSTPSAAVGPHSTVIATGSTYASNVSQQAVFLKATLAGNVSPVSLTAITGGLIPEVAVNSTFVADGEQVAVGSANGYPAVWRRGSSGSWTLVTPLSLVSASPGLAALSSVTHGSAGWIAAGTPGPVILTSADGTTWQAAGGNITQDLAKVAAVATASGPSGNLIDGKLVASGGACVADDWWSPDLSSWTRAHTTTPPSGSSQVLAVAAGAHGFVTAGSHNGKPAVWTTTNGRLWTIDVLVLPTGASSGLLQQVAISGNRVVALGQQTTASGTLPLAELSADGGTTWQQVAFPSAGPGTAVTALTARSGGFTAAGQFGAAGQQDAAVWTSATGTSWTQSAVSGLAGGGSHDITTLAPAGAAVSGIDSVQTQAGQRFVARLLH